MTDTSTVPVALISLKPGDLFTFKNNEYVVLEHAQSRTTIATIGGGQIKIYKLAMAARVRPNGHSDTDLQLGLVALRPPVTVKAGDTVRIVSNPRTRKAGIAGHEVVVAKVNAKTISLVNGWRLSPTFVEKV